MGLSKIDECNKYQINVAIYDFLCILYYTFIIRFYVQILSVTTKWIYDHRERLSFEYFLKCKQNIE